MPENAYPMLSETQRIAMLTPPATKPVRMVLDTDTYNEIDDQFAVTYALLAPDAMTVERLYAAPFHNSRSDGPGDGMEKSYEEILRLLDRLGVSPEGLVFKGSREYLPGADKPVDSDAARDLVRLAMTASPEEPLYVAAVGAITNVASAILMEPEIVGRIVVVWLGGHAFHWQHTKEFNLQQDLHASRVVFDSGVPLVMLPVCGVTSHLHTTLPEIEAHVAGRGPIGDYLANIYRGFFTDHYCRSKVIWDIAAIAWIVNAGWIDSVLTHSPILTDNVTWSFDTRRHLMCYARHLNRDAIFGDLFRRIEARAGQ